MIEEFRKSPRGAVSEGSRQCRRCILSGGQTEKIDLDRILMSTTPAKLEYVKAVPISLKGHPDFSERWLHDQISADPSLLGLGELTVIAREKVQIGAGRLDMLLTDADAESPVRYEIEIMLGPTDPSHIIRTIEYWDIERRRYPAYDHIAVLVAEQVTARFLNVIALFAGSIPIVAIQLILNHLVP